MKIFDIFNCLMSDFRNFEHNIYVFSLTKFLILTPPQICGI